MGHYDCDYCGANADRYPTCCSKAVASQLEYQQREEARRKKREFVEAYVRGETWAKTAMVEHILKDTEALQVARRLLDTEALQAARHLIAALDQAGPLDNGMK